MFIFAAGFLTAAVAFNPQHGQRLGVIDPLSSRRSSARIHRWPSLHRISNPPSSPTKLSVAGTTIVETDDEAVDYFGQSTIGDLKPDPKQAAGLPPLVVDSDADIEAFLKEEALPAELQTAFPFGDPTKGVFCSRTLNLRSIQVIGYDMDYTLVRYRVQVWENRAYHYAKEWLCNKGFWVSGLTFKENLVCRGLIIDKEEGNLLKVDRFGYVRQAMHGTARLDQTEIQRTYGRAIVDLRESRWSFLNTLFSVSEATLYLQLVDRLDDGSLLQKGVFPFEASKCDTYLKLFSAASKSVFRAHVTSKLKSEVLEEPSKFIELDPDLVRTLLDQRLAGKKLVLITNSDWSYTDTIMRYLVNTPSTGDGKNGADALSSSSTTTPRWGEAPPLQNWRSLFDVVIASARKPDFFTGKMPVYEVVSAPPLLGMVGESERIKSITDDDDDEGSAVDNDNAAAGSHQGSSSDGTLLREVFGLSEGRVYHGGTAGMVEKLFNVSRERILYVGDHVFGDVTIAKSSNRWRTLLVLQELETEVAGLAGSHETQLRLKTLLSRKDRLADILNHLRTTLRRMEARVDSPWQLAFGEKAQSRVVASGDNNPEQEGEDEAAIRIAATNIERILGALVRLDLKIEQAHVDYSANGNAEWGYMSRAGFSDKSHLMRQIEKYADVYTSRVSNLLRYTPYAYFRAGQQSLAHDGDDLAVFLDSSDALHEKASLATTVLTEKADNDLQSD